MGTPLTRFLATLTVGQLREMKADVRNEIDAAAARVEELQADLARIEQAIAEKAGGRRAVPIPNVEPAANGAAQRSESMKDTILDIMRQNAAAVWTTQDILDELLKRGAAPGGSKPLNTVGNRLLDLNKAKQIHRHGRGTYALTPRRDDRLPIPSEGGETD